MEAIVLCADSLTLRYPELMGLEGESVEAADWLVTFAKAKEVRAYLKGAAGPREVWINSADDMDAINVAAALKRDRPDHEVLLAGQEVSGSVLSRAQAAELNATLSREGLAQRYAAEKQRRARGSAQERGDGALRNRDASLADGDEGRSGSGLSDVGAAAAEGRMGPGAQVPGVGRQELPQAPIADADWASLAEAASGDLPGAHSRPSPRRPAGEVASGTTAVAPAPGATGRLGAMAQERIQGAQATTLPRADAALPRPAKTAAHGRAATVLAVVSGSGGAGKSAVSVVAAYLAAARGLRVLLVDCDLQFGDCALLTGAAKPLAIDRAIADPALLEEVELEAAVPCLVGAPPRLEQAEVLGARLPGLIEEASFLFDLVVVNTGASWAEYHAQLLECSTAALFLVDQRLSSVRACQRALDLCVRCGIATGSFLFAVNRCARGSLFTSIDVSCALNGASVMELKDGGAEVEELLGAGLPAELIGSKSAFCDSVEELVDRVLAAHGTALPARPEEGQPPQGGKGASRVARRRRKHAKAAGRRGGRGGEGGARPRAQLPFGLAGARS